MALVRGAAASTAGTLSIITATPSVTGPDGTVFFFVAQYSGSAAAIPINVTVGGSGSGVTHIDFSSTVSTVRIDAYRKVGLSTSSPVVSVEFNGYTPMCALITIPYQGVDQTTPHGTVFKNGASASGNPNITPGVTGVNAGEEVIDGIISVVTNMATITKDASQSLIAEHEDISGNSVVSAGSSAKSGTGTLAMNWTTSPTDSFWDMLAFAVKPSVVVTVSYPLRRRFIQGILAR